MKQGELKDFLNSREPAEIIGFSSVVLLTITGIIGCFAASPIDIDKFVKFINAFAFVLVPFILIIAGSSGAKKYIAAKFPGEAEAIEEEDPPEEEKK